ncbi:DEAD/DEAH box helicase [Cellulomonas terrae]|uniref:DEAD/DEAH box helicase n=1 Tax=Cellulomonas terrae TaxID=311234 RepID=UPI001649B116|nr:DEAD/DEAH box helicase [Cellulomonas terrae]
MPTTRTNREILADIIDIALQLRPGSDKRQIARTINSIGDGTPVTPAELNSILYERTDRFRYISDAPRLWFTIPTQRSKPTKRKQRRDVELCGPPARTWQTDALKAWRKNDRRGIVEAVTGTGKTRVAILAAHKMLESGGRVTVVVPTLDLLDQWHKAIEKALPGQRIGRLGGGSVASLDECDILITTVQSGHQNRIGSDKHRALLIADEVHRYGAEKFAAALQPEFERRLGLTATLERLDEGVDEYLKPYFGKVVFRCGFERAFADEVLSPFRVALVPVPLRAHERVAYDRADERVSKTRKSLIKDFGCDPYNFGEFMRDVSVLAAGPRDEARETARAYLSAFTTRKKTVAEAESKFEALHKLAPLLAASSGSLVFAETVAGAQRSAEVLDDQGVPTTSFSSEDDRETRRALLAEFHAGTLKALAAPRVLDEGIDVPNADVGVIVAASRSRRQMIQRMGRVLRKADGKQRATFVVLYVEDSMEDPEISTDETFLDAITGFADDITRLDVNDPVTLARWIRG